MIRKDQRGYVLSGLGFLLLIPVIILIPIALSVQEQSAEIPITFTRSDTLFSTFNAIRRDITGKTYNHGLNITNVTYRHDQSTLFADRVIRMYYNTRRDIYISAYNQTVDTIDIRPNFPPSSINMGNTTGTIPLRNGIRLFYNLTGIDNSTNSIIYNYTLTFEINILIDLTKANSGHNQTFDTKYSFPWHINTTTSNLTTARTNINTFIDGVRNRLGPYT